MAKQKGRVGSVGRSGGATATVNNRLQLVITASTNLMRRDPGHLQLCPNPDNLPITQRTLH